MLKGFLTPWGTYRNLRDQLGSIRNVYLAGNAITRRDDFKHHDEIVLLLHGFFQTRNIWEVMEDRLRFDGYGVVSFNLGGFASRFNTHPVDKIAQLVSRKIEDLAERHHFDALHIIGHSKGGIVARRYIQHYGGDRRVKSLITLGTPHHGTPTALAGVAISSVLPAKTSASELLPSSRIVRRLNDDDFPVHVPLTSIYSREDLVCPFWCSILRPRPGEHHLANVEIRGPGHSELTWDPAVYAEVRKRLEYAVAQYAERQDLLGRPATEEAEVAAR